MTSSIGRACRRLALTTLVLMGSPLVVAGQVNVQISGTVESIWGPTMTLRTNPPPPRRVTFGERPSPASPLPSTIEVNLEDTPASQWVFLRPGERVAVVGVPSADGRRVTAIRIIGGAGPSRGPEAP